MTWSSVDWAATEAAVGRIQDRIFRAAKIKRPRLEPDDEQSSCPVLRGLGSGNGARLPDYAYGKTGTAVLWFLEHKLDLPAKPNGGEVVWRRPRYSTILQIIANPAYGGAVRPELPDAHHTWGLAADGPRRKECFTERRPHSPGCRYPAARRSNPTCRAPGTMG